jgi:hypothetical protein
MILPVRVVAGANCCQRIGVRCSQPALFSVRVVHMALFSVRVVSSRIVFGASCLQSHCFQRALLAMLSLGCRREVPDEGSVA